MKICCYLGHRSRNSTLLADLSQVYRNIPLPTIRHLEVDFDIKSFDQNISPGKLFYYYPDSEPKFEAINFSEYPNMIKAFELFSRSVDKRPYILFKGLKLSLKNRVLNLLHEYYSNVAKLEHRNQMIDEILS